MDIKYKRGVLSGYIYRFYFQLGWIPYSELGLFSFSILTFLSNEKNQWINLEIINLWIFKFSIHLSINIREE